MGVAKPLLVVLVGFGILFFISKSMESNKEIASCKPMLDNRYQEVLREGILDESLWRLGGYDSAQDYAKSSTKVYYEGLKKGGSCK